MEDEIDIQHATEKQEHKGDGCVSQTEVLGKDISLEVELKCHQDQNKGVTAKSREQTLFTPRHKSFRWDQLRPSWMISHITAELGNGLMCNASRC